VRFEVVFTVDVLSGRPRVGEGDRAQRCAGDSGGSGAFANRADARRVVDDPSVDDPSVVAVSRPVLRGGVFSARVEYPAHGCCSGSSTAARSTPL